MIQQTDRFKEVVSIAKKYVSPVLEDMGYDEPIFITINMVLEFKQKFGFQGIDDLYGFVKWAEKHSGDNIDKDIRQVFCHDLGGRNETGMSPRSSGYFKEVLK